MPKIVLEIHPHDAEQRGIREGDWVEVTSRAGSITLRALLTERVAPGVVYTTFHHPESGANVVTTENSDWATNCPEYKVTAVEVMPTARRPERYPPERIIPRRLLPPAKDHRRAPLAGCLSVTQTSGHSSSGQDGQRYRRLLRLHARP